MGNKPCCAVDADKLEASGTTDVLSMDESPLGDRSKEPLTKLEISVVEETWKKAAGLGAEKVGVILFKNIFEIAPEALNLFSFKKEPNVKSYETPGLKAHGVKVVTTVGAAVDGLRNLDALVPVLKELAIKHVAYGVQPPHFDVVGKALMKTLEAGLGSAFNPSARLAWSKVWHTVSSTMIEAMSTAPAPAVPAAAKEPVIVDPNGPLTQEEIQMVKDSWASADALGAEMVGVILFKKIFELAPEALQLFPFKNEPDPYSSDTLKAHATKVVNTVGVAVSKLDTIAEVVPTLQDLGKKHVGYGVKEPHYEVVGKALIKTLSVGLGPNLFKPEVEASWVKVYGIVSKTMIGDNYK